MFAEGQVERARETLKTNTRGEEGAEADKLSIATFIAIVCGRISLWMVSNVASVDREQATARLFNMLTGVPVVNQNQFAPMVNLNAC